MSRYFIVDFELAPLWVSSIVVPAEGSQDEQEYAGAGAAQQPCGKGSGEEASWALPWHGFETSLNPSGGKSTDKDRFCRRMALGVFVPDPAQGWDAAPCGAGAAGAGRARRWLLPKGNASRSGSGGRGVALG